MVRSFSLFVVSSKLTRHGVDSVYCLVAYFWIYSTLIKKKDKTMIQVSPAQNGIPEGNLYFVTQIKYIPNLVSGTSLAVCVVKFWLPRQL